MQFDRFEVSDCHTIPVDLGRTAKEVVAAFWEVVGETALCDRLDINQGQNWLFDYA
jgi:hypothetical protein